MINAESSVSTSTSGASAADALKLAAGAAGRCLMVIEVVATSSAIRSPVTHSTRSHQCEPMSPNARDGPPALESDPPAGGQRVEQPVLQIAAVDQVDRAEVLALHPGPHLPGHRVEAVGERHGVDHARSARRPPAACSGVGQADADRLLAEHVLAGLHQRDRVGHVGGVRGADVHHVDVGGRDLVDVGVRLLDPPLGRDLAGSAPGWRPSPRRPRHRPAARPAGAPRRSCPHRGLPPVVAPMGPT